MPVREWLIRNLCGEEMVKYTEEQILDLILKDYKGKKNILLAPLVRSRKGHYRELFEQIRKKGYPVCTGGR